MFQAKFTLFGKTRILANVVVAVRASSYGKAQPKIRAKLSELMSDWQQADYTLADGRRGTMYRAEA